MNSELKFGLFSGFTFSVWVMLEFFTGIHNNRMEVAQYTEMIAGFIPLIFIFSGIRYRKLVLQNGVLTFGQGVRAGMIISLVSSAIISAFLYVYVNMINSSYNYAKIEFIKSKLLDEKLTEEVFKQQMEGYNSMYNATFLSHLSLMVMFTSIGIVVSAVLSLFLKSKAKPVM